ncbi:MAG: DNA mismatch repair endonuclease MutL [Anaerolineae bacterium]
MASPSQRGDPAIRRLPAEVTAQISAGEVVERPASVVKELLENAIDASARTVTVELRKAGRRLIRVTDDGRGIPPDQVELAFQRHATSKLARAADLHRITTLGFRGEALPSIAAVARVTMVTRTPGQDHATWVRLQDGRLVDQGSRGAPPGTRVSAEDLFLQVPARLKFLRTDATEWRHILDLVSRYAMAHPHLRITLMREGKPVFNAPGSGRLIEVLVATYGAEVASQLLEIQEAPSGDSLVSGFVGSAQLHRSSGRDLTILVNGRWVKDRMLNFAVRQAYQTLIPRGRYPLAVVRMDLPPASLDVNVHPAKWEVRFREPRQVFEWLQRAVRRTVAASSPIAQVSPPPSTVREAREGWTPSQRPLTGPAPGLHPDSDRLPPLRVLGQVRGTYIVAEGPDGLYLIDQHAAHERILFEEIRRQRAGPGVASQILLQPRPLELTASLSAAIESHGPDLAAWGYQIEPFGERTYLLRGLPALLAEGDPERALAQGLDEAGRESGSDWEEAFVIGIACRSAVRAGQALEVPQMEELIERLGRTDSPRTCMHGRPTMLQMSDRRLERDFGRR